MEVAIGIVSYLAGWFFAFLCWILWGAKTFPDLGKMMSEDEYLLTIFTWSFWWPITTPGMFIVWLTDKIKQLCKKLK